MLKLKGCPKCQGALHLVSDMYGRYVNCLQCGFTRDLPDSPARAKTMSPSLNRRSAGPPSGFGTKGSSQWPGVGVDRLSAGFCRTCPRQLPDEG